MNRTISAILKTFGKPPDENLFINDERVAQYKDIDVQDDELTSLPYSEISKRACEMYVDKIVKSTPEVARIADRLQLHGVQHIKVNTKSMLLSGGEIVIVLDSHIQNILWVLNKCFLYGHQQCTEHENVELFKDALTYFASLSLISQGNILPFPNKPRTPPHADENLHHIL